MMSDTDTFNLKHFIPSLLQTLMSEPSILHFSEIRGRQTDGCTNGVRTKKKWGKWEMSDRQSDARDARSLGCSDHTCPETRVPFLG